MKAGHLASQVAFELAVQQNEDAGRNGKDCKDHAQAAHRDERGQARENESSLTIGSLCF